MGFIKAADVSLNILYSTSSFIVNLAGSMMAQCSYYPRYASSLILHVHETLFLKDFRGSSIFGQPGNDVYWITPRRETAAFFSSPLLRAVIVKIQKIIRLTRNIIHISTFPRRYGSNSLI